MKVFILGASSSLGSSFVKLFVQKGIEYIPHYRTHEDSLDHKNHEVLFGDVNDEIFLNNLEIFLKRNKPSVVINCICKYDNSPFSEINDEILIKSININITSNLLILKRVINHFQKNRGGFYINISSIAEDLINKDESLYVMSKTAISKILKCIRLENLNYPIKIINVKPGAFKSRITMARESYDMLPKPDEIAKTILKIIELKDFNVNEIEFRRT